MNTPKLINNKKEETLINNKKEETLINNKKEETLINNDEDNSFSVNNKKEETLINNKKEDNSFSINITSDPSCINFHRMNFNKPMKLYKIINVCKDIEIKNHKINLYYFSLCMVSGTRIRGKYYLPSDIKLNVATISFNKQLLNIGNDLLGCSHHLVNNYPIHIDQKKLSNYGKRKFNIGIAICDQNLLITRRLGNLIYTGFMMAEYIILVIMSSTIIDESVSKAIIDKINSKLQDNWKNKLIIIEVSKKPINIQKRFIMNALIQYRTFFELNFEQIENYYQKIRIKK